MYIIVVLSYAFLRMLYWCEARTDGFETPEYNIDEVPKFSFDIFLKYNPTINEPLIRNNLKIFVGKNMTNPSNQPKSQMFEFKTQHHTRIYVLHASMVSNWVNSRVSARNRPIHITCLGFHLGRCLGFQTLAHPKC